MRWEQLFDDLEAQLEAQRRLESDAELVDLVRAERARVTWLERLRAQVGPVALVVAGARHRGHVVEVGIDWLLLRPLAEPGALSVPSDVVVPVPAVVAVTGLAPGIAPLPGSVARALGLGSVLRGLVRDRSVVTVALADGSALTGTPSAVGADHLDLRCHEADDPTTPGSRWTLPFAALTSVRLR